MRADVNITVNRPADEVFAFVADFANNSLWQSGVDRAEMTSEGALGVGSKYTQYSRFLGREIIFHFEVLAYEPGRMIQYKTYDGSFHTTVTRMVETANGGAGVRAIVEGESGGFFQLAAPLLQRMMRRQIQGDYDNLKQYLEGSPSP